MRIGLPLHRGTSCDIEEQTFPTHCGREQMYYRSRGWRKVLLRGERRWADAKYRGKYYEIKSATYNISSGEPLATSSTTSPPETTTDNSDNLGSAMSITNYRIPFSRLRRIVTCIRPIQKNQPNLDLYLVRRFKIWHFPIVVSYLCIVQNQKNQCNLVLYLVRRSKIFVLVATLFSTFSVPIFHF